VPANRWISSLAVPALAAVLAIGVRAGEPGPTQGPSPRENGTPAEGPSPAPVFATIEKAWNAGDASALVQSFGRRKVYLSLPDGGPAGGQFSRDQSYYILKNLFDAARTEEFTFVTIRTPEEQRRSAFGLARRVFRPRDAGSAIRDRVFVSLVLEGERWVVSEIKSVR